MFSMLFCENHAIIVLINSAFLLFTKIFLIAAGRGLIGRTNSYHQSPDQQRKQKYQTKGLNSPRFFQKDRIDNRRIFQETEVFFDAVLILVKF